MSKSKPFRVALTADFYDADDRLKYRDIGLAILEQSARLEVTRFADHRPEVAPDQFANVNAAIVLTPRVTAHSLSSSDNLLALARFGVGFDGVDVMACTAADIVLTITTGAVDHSVAEATVGWMLGLTHHLRTKDRLVREGAWDERSSFMGSELRDRTLGIVGFGGIGRAVVRMLSSFSMAKPLVFDPFVNEKNAAAIGAMKVTLDELLEQSDFVSLHCPLNEQTRNLITARELSLMKPTAYLINTARGGIVDEDALHAALVEGRLAGAALDCFEVEPVTCPSRFAGLDQVLLAPHAIAWTHELFRDIGRTACQGIVDLVHGRQPRGIVNPEVFNRDTFRAKWDRLCGPWPADCASL